VLLCVINLSEGRDPGLLGYLAGVAGASLLDVHADPHHHRSVWTLAGPDVHDAARALAAAAVERLDIRHHVGVHPRIGAVDVVPWVHLQPASAGELGPADIGPAVEARRSFATWVGGRGLPAVCYGPADGAVPERTLPEVRRRLWRDLRPDTGPDAPHPSAGAVAVGARPALVAYNLWLADTGADARAALGVARAVAAAVRGPAVRTLGLAVGDAVQVSCNLIDPWEVGPGAAFDAVASRVAVERAELVGLVPAAVLAADPRERWPELDLGPARTIEARLEQAGLDGGRA
jgi:glutamate formiminotransferase